MLLLCTDGLTQYANSQDILTVTSNKGPQDSVDGLIQFANDRGGADNITVLVVKVEAGISLPLLTVLQHSKNHCRHLGLALWHFLLLFYWVLPLQDNL